MRANRHRMVERATLLTELRPPAINRLLRLICYPFARFLTCLGFSRRGAFCWVPNSILTLFGVVFRGRTAFLWISAGLGLTRWRPLFRVADSGVALRWCVGRRLRAFVVSVAFLGYVALALLLCPSLHVDRASRRRLSTFVLLFSTKLGTVLLCLRGVRLIPL